MDEQPKIKIANITIPDGRWRKTFNEQKLQELADSIRDHGLIEPIVIDDKNLLVAGERRIRAHWVLGLDEIEYVRKSNLDEWERKIIELEENLHRESLTYEDEVEAKLQLHELYQEKYGKTRETQGIGWSGQHSGGWKIEDTAEMFGESKGGMVQDLQLAKAIRANPDLAKKDSKIAAFKAMKVGTELSIRRQIAEVLAGVSEERGEEPIQIINGDSRKELKQYDDESFDFCVTDPQYGIGVHDMQDTFPNRGDVRQGIEFDDSRKVLQDVVKPIMAETYRVLRPSSHCYVFFAIARYTEVRALLEEVGFWVCPTPLFWIKNNALNLRPWLTYPVNYEPIFYCAKGYPPRPLTTIQPLSTFDHPIMGGGSKVHPTEKPLAVVKWLIGNCSQPKERGVDPFLGGGTFTLACKQMDRLAVGIEIDSVWWVEAKKKVEEV